LAAKYYFSLTNLLRSRLISKNLKLVKTVTAGECTTKKTITWERVRPKLCWKDRVKGNIEKVVRPGINWKELALNGKI